MRFPRQEDKNGLSFPSLGDLPDPEIEPAVPALEGRFFTTESPGKPVLCSYYTSPVSLPGESHGQRSLVGYSSGGLEELDTTERLNVHKTS